MIAWIICLSVFCLVEILACDFTFSRPSIAFVKDPEICLLWSNLNNNLTCKQSLNQPTISLATHGSIDRLERILLQANQWKGPVFASIFVTSMEQQLLVINFKKNHPDITITIAMGESDEYPVNFLRNLVIWTVSMNSKSKDEFMLLLDADAIPNSNYSTLLNEIIQANVEKVDKTLFVLPAFDQLDENDNITSIDKTQMQSLVLKNKAQIMHHPRPSYQFNLPKWFSTLDDGFYSKYQLMNEHYSVFKIRLISELHPFHEGFVGRGFNKQSNHFELWAAGYEYYFLPNSFLINLPNNKKTKEFSSVIKKEMVNLWKQFRSHVVERFNLQCRESFWRLCDEKGFHCDKVCSRYEDDLIKNDGERRTNKKQSKEAEAIIPNLSWTVFERKMERENDERKEYNMLHLSREDCVSTVDVVYTWVNGSDPIHISQREKHLKELQEDKGMSSSGSSVYRFRDFGEKASTLKHSIRSIIKNAPFVRNIYIVLGDDQNIPSFLNKSSTRVFFVRHSTIMNSSCLPTFNSCAIESQLHKIPNLSKCFLYLNDDVFLIEKLSLEFYWPQTEKLPRAVFDGNEAPDRKSKDFWQQKLVNVRRIIKDSYPSLQKVFLVGHHGHFMTREIIEKIYEEESLAKELKRTECEKWRTLHSVWLPFVYSNALVYYKKPYVVKETSLYYPLIGYGNTTSLKDVFKQLDSKNEYRWFCLNDILDSKFDPRIVDVLELELTKLFELTEEENKSNSFTDVFL